TSAHGKFVWYELATKDGGDAKAFYAQILGWAARKVSQGGRPYSLLTAGETPVAGLMPLPEEAGASPHWLGYVGVDDVDHAAFERNRSNAEKVIGSKKRERASSEKPIPHIFASRALDAAVLTTRRLGGAVYVPPTEVPGVSRFSIIADPQGATLGLIERIQPSQEAAIDLTAPGRVGWHELLAADHETAFAFYSALLGWRKAERQEGFMGAYQSFAFGAQTIGGMFTKPPMLPHPFWLYYFNVDDIDAAARRVEAAGGAIYYGPIEAPGGACILHCADSQGATFALLERRPVKPVGYFTPRPSAN
ncbi:MAG TPA: VOC family protein, partial [Methylocystis sp.]|nr:VOC family protein [Methylocystis sp.]